MNTKHHLCFFSEGFFRVLASVLVGVLFAILLLLVLSIPATDVQALSIKPQSYSQVTAPLTNTIYLPLVLDQTSTLPTLVAPQNGATLDILIPLFQWDMGSQPTNTSACLAFDTNPNPTSCRASGFGSSGPQSVVLTYNLQSGTTYYWRIGAVYNSDYSNKYWSEEWSFTTGPTGGTILPPPALISPADDSSVSPNNLILEWNAVGGAVKYSITIYNIDQDNWYGFSSSTTQLDLSGWSTLNPSTHYEWYVKARNNYAWGTSSANWQFTTTSGSTSPMSTETVIGLVCVNPDGTQLNIIR